MGKPTGFMEYPRELPLARLPAERIRDWFEFHEHSEAEKLAKNAEDASWWKQRNTRHWSVASADEVRSALRTCRGSLRILSRSAKRFEPELIHREWKR